MPKPYSLSLYSQVLHTNRFERSLTTAAKGWKRSKRSQGGCWQGSFSIEGTATELYDYFRRWLGYDVQERAGGMMSWRGMVYEMDLTINGVTRRRSLDLMANRVKTTYITADIVGGELVENNSFENQTAGAPNDDFWGWTEANGAGGSVQQAGAGHTGNCVQMTGDAAAGYASTYIRQNVNVTPGAPHLYTFWAKSDSVAGSREFSGWWGVQDAAGGGGQWLWGPQIILSSDAVWHEKTHTFIGPASGEVILWFYAPEASTDVCYYDDVSLLEQGEGVYETPWVEIAVVGGGGPHNIYGVKEEILHLDNYPQETSIAYRDAFLNEHAYPWPRPVAASNATEKRLDVFVAGYVHTMNWMYVNTGDGTEHDVNAWISLIVGDEFGRDPLHEGFDVGAGDCQFVKVGDIKSNDYLTAPNGPLQVAQLTGVEERPWDVLQELTALGDYDGNPWRIWVRLDRQVNYAPLDTTPRYFIRRDGIYDTMAGAMPSNPWLMQPAVFRDMSYRPAATEPGSFLTDVQDIYVEEVEMADGWDEPALKTSLFSEADILLAQAERGEEGV